MSEKILTVVVPSYNVEAYLEETLNSFIHPDILDDLEVLIVNDGSADRTEEIGKRYEMELSLIHISSVRSMNSALGGFISRRTQVPKPRDQVFEEFDKLVKRLTQLQKILKNRELASMRIVTTPERIVMDEARRSYTWINEYDFGVDAVYVNKIYPEEAMQGYFSGWTDMQAKDVYKRQWWNSLIWRR